jgi:hypothetical protein
MEKGIKLVIFFVVPELLCAGRPNVPTFIAPSQSIMNTSSNANESKEAAESDPEAPSIVVNMSIGVVSSSSNKAEDKPAQIQGKVSKRLMDRGYVPPVWSSAPNHKFELEVIREGVEMGVLDVSVHTHYMFGRAPECDFIIEHPSISRRHAVIQFRDNGNMCLYDLETSNGTFLNRKRLEPKTYVNIYVNDHITFGSSTRRYIVRGPEELTRIVVKKTKPTPEAPIEAPSREKIIEALAAEYEEKLREEQASLVICR